MSVHESKAREIVRSGFDGHDVKMCNGESLVAAIASALREAEAGEREACAKIAETEKTLKAWLPTNDDGTGETEHTTIHGEAIAAAIRSRNETDE